MALRYFLFCCTLLFAGLSQAQISGVVLDASGEALPGVNVITPSGNGSSTDPDGNFSVNAEPGDSLTFSAVGMQSMVLPATAGMRITLLEETEMLDQVVVTALGISREKKSLGYAVADVDPEELTEARDPNLINTLSGKVAGVQINKTTGGPSASSRIVLRGNNSLGGNNQPLFVVDGIPIDNQTVGTGGMWGGIDYGSPISDISPDDIENISILKGPNAAALYGSRASNGVVVITTKKGRRNQGIGITVSSSFSLEHADIQKEFQNVYGAGTNGQFQYNDDGLPFFNTSLLAKSWGPKMEGQTYVDWDGEIRTFSPQPDNYREFFEIGQTQNHSVAIDGGNERSTFRLSYAALRNKGTIPNSTFDRNQIGLAGTTTLSTGLRAEANVSYIRQHALNRLNQSDGRGAARNYNFMPRNISTESLEDYADAFGAEKIWYTPWAWQSNPFWVQWEDRNEDSRDRVMGSVALTWDITDWLSLRGRAGMDFYYERRENLRASGSFTSPTGDLSYADNDFTERNFELLALANHKLNDDFTIGATFGGNRMYQFREWSSTRAQRLSIPGFYNPIFAEDPDDFALEYFLSEKRINSLFGSARIDYRGILFAEVTGRNDWSSTLPLDNNSYFYSSVSASWVFGEHLGIEGDALSFGKLRASWAEVGGDDRPYLTSLIYVNSPEQSFGDAPRFVINQPLALEDLRPERTRSAEVGVDLRFWKNRITTDLTFYQTNTYDQIIPGIAISAASGFNTAVVNAGEVRNRGIEALVSATIIETDKFSWTTSANFTKNQSLVVSLPEGVESFPLPGQQWGVQIVAEPGRPYGDIVGVSILKDEDGNRLVDENGMYMAGPRETMGNFNPDWMLGLSQQINYGAFSMSFLVDIRRGGQIYSASNMYAHGYSGTVVQTLEGREEWYQSEADREAAGVDPEDWTATGGHLAQGVYAPGTIINGEDVSGQVNETYVNPENYWGQFSNWTNEIHEPHVYDAGFVKLREASISYRFKRESIRKLHLGQLSLSLFGRNLWLIQSDVPNIDPEASYNNGNGQGIEYGTYPVSRSIGLQLNASF